MSKMKKKDKKCSDRHGYLFSADGGASGKRLNKKLEIYQSEVSFSGALLQKLLRSRRELSLLIYSESVTNNSARNTGENMKWYSQLPNTISILQIHPKRNLRLKID